MFLIDKNDLLDTKTILKIINQYQTNELPKMKKWANYYAGKHEILNKRYHDTTKPCNRIITNFCATIADNYLGYMTGNSINYETDSAEVIDVLKYNDYQEQDKELLRNALIYGYGAEIAWVDEDGKIRFTALDSREVIPVYYNTIEKEKLACVIRMYPADSINDNPDWIVEIYMADRTCTYKSTHSLESLELLDEKPNYFNQVPVCIMPLNEAWESVYAGVIGLNDAYNQILSGEIDDFDSFADAYLVMAGLDNVTKEEMQEMREMKAIVLPDGGEVNYLTKNISDVQTENILANIKHNIYLVANCVDFSDEAFGTASGIAMKMKLLGMENNAGVIEKHMTKALQKRIELICSILSITGGEDIWREVNIVFTRNIPVDVTSEVQQLMTLRGLVSDRTLLSQIPFVKDVEDELAQIKAEKEANLSMYSFGGVEYEDEETAE